MYKKIIYSLFLLIFLLISSVWAGEEKEQNINFTDDEKEWLKTHHSIRVANETDWPPFDFNENDVPKGFVIDYIKLLASKTGLEIEFVHGYSWTELVELFKKRKIDVMPVFYKNDERKSYTLYTEPYYRGKLSIFINKDDKTGKINFVDKSVGMETSHGSIPLVKKMIPGIVITEIDSKVELVQKLATKELDAIIGNPFVFYYQAKENQINNIQLSSYINMNEDEQRKTSFHVGIRKDWPVLHSILQKVMKNVSDEEMQAIEGKWADIEIAKRINWLYVAQVSCAVILVILFLLWHNRKLKSMVVAKTHELKKLNEGLESKVKERTKELTALNTELNKSLEEIKTLRGIIPICSYCKKIRDDKGLWNQLEAYIHSHSHAEFSHGACPECYKKQMEDIGKL